MDLARLLRTVAPLKPVQVYGRLLFRLRKPVPDLRPAPPRRTSGAWIPAIDRGPSLLGPARVRFLDRDGDIDEPLQWNDRSRDKLWLYNLHYFDELGAPETSENRVWRRNLVSRWIKENPPGTGNGWEPYPTSLRVVNWIKWALAGQPMEADWIDSLAVQTRWLSRRLEWHLLGNHLFANAKALIFAGLFFDGPEAEGWLSHGWKILKKEIPEQVLADGGHFERSPMYHAIILEDVLDMLNLASTFGPDKLAGFDELPTVAAGMLAWAASMSHPDGDVAFFNDAAFGIAPKVAELDAYATRLQLEPAARPTGRLTRLASSGYLRAQAGPAVTLIDAAPVGPDYLPGHAHADTLSFELSLGKERVIVNGGTSTYAPGARRAAERGTAAHSTVEIDGQSSSEVWASFRVGRRAKVVELSAWADGSVIEVAASHEGYRWRPGRPVHRRTWRLDDEGLTVIDRITGRATTATARFHLAPGIGVRASSDGRTGVLTVPNGRTIRWYASAPVTLTPGQWHPRFGAAVPSLILVADALGGLETRFDW